MNMVKGRVGIPVSEFWAWAVGTFVNEFGARCLDLPDTSSFTISIKDSNAYFLDLDGNKYFCGHHADVLHQIKALANITNGVVLGVPYIDGTKLFCDYVSSENWKDLDYQWEAVRVSNHKKYRLTRFKPLWKPAQILHNLMSMADWK